MGRDHYACYFEDFTWDKGPGINEFVVSWEAVQGSLYHDEALETAEIISVREIRGDISKELCVIEFAILLLCKQKLAT